MVGGRGGLTLGTDWTRDAGNGKLHERSDRLLTYDGRTTGEQDREQGPFRNLRFHIYDGRRRSAIEWMGNGNWRAE